MSPFSLFFSLPSAPSSLGRGTRYVLGAVASLVLATVLAGPAQGQNTFTVDATGDGADANPGDGSCATAGGDCTLRAAIQEANNTANSGGPDEISFSISGGGPHVIQPSSALPNITDPVVIDGTSEPDHPNTSALDAPVVEIDGTNTPDGIDGLIVDASDVTIKGLAVVNFDGIGIRVNDELDGVLIGENYIGVSTDGSSAGNGGDGVYIRAASSRLGDDGSEGTDGNIISNNGSFGIQFNTGNQTVVVGNRVGTSPDGMSAMGNGIGGIVVSFASSVTIGGPSADERNVISGNDGEGIQTPEEPITVTNNYIGVAADGMTDLGNADDGIQLRSGVTSNTIGPDNVISGNGGAGVLLRDFSGNGTTGNVVKGNLIGTNAGGTAAVANDAGGVVIEEGASNNTIGGTSDAARNVISGNAGNGQDGVTLRSGAENNVVQGNYIGTNASGTGAIPNTGGVNLAFGATSDNTIGGTATGAGNLISGNEFDGVVVNNSAGPNTVQGNQIGVDVDGNPLGNGGDGIAISNSANTTVGGTANDAGNTIAYNVNGVIVTFSNRGTGNSVRGNRIFANTERGIDLGNNGRTSNDDTPAGSEDDDDGANRLQNFPVIQSTDYDEAANEITLTYEVPSQPGLSAPGASTYPIEVDIYRADGDDQEGEAYLHADTYRDSDFNNGPTKTITFSPDASVSTSDQLVATATDANGNTSEFSNVSNPLPVELASFAGTQTGSDAVALRWTTASEQNNAGFAVQRRRVEPRSGETAQKASVSTEEWDKVGFVASKAEGGTASQALSYRYVAEDLPVGTHEFRLKQVDLDGSATRHDAVTVELRMEEALRLGTPTPHPVQSRATLSFAVKEKQETTLRLYNTLGQRVATLYRGTPTAGETQTVQLSAADLTSGTYFLRLRTGERTRTQRVTVVR